ncbi:GNAT family N-acetyltransferase [Arthrobacter sp. ISL-48]|uniref:GNAT family N-acetyltransferase n=1 Tax=Arthrobacter sp. ISL-48 TaxID=2819110 RepID=UPI001BE4EA19|nr:GNAT family N-acetyltransferase [Arthrobacter sp. ISL-48]
MAGYIDFDPDANDMPAAGDVNISYAVHPWARRQAVATTAVLQICNYLAEEDIGDRAIIRAARENTASLGVAERCGFRYIAENPSTTDHRPDGLPVIYRTYALNLRDRSNARQAPGLRGGQPSACR